ncbi:MAG TPA: Holliday junction resolvase RuvX [Candidatus Limnocylindrales bacterium]
MRLLGIDLGDRRIGLASGDTASGVAVGLPTVPRGSDAADLRRLERLVAERAIEGIVLGLPRNTDGTEGEQAAATRAWAMGVLAPLGIAFVFRDERYTSQDAEASLGRAPRGPSGGPPSPAARERRRRSIDREAARLILQAELDARSEVHA